VIFTTHDSILLDTKLLRRDQFWFTSKNESGESVLYPLTQQSPRAGESLLRGYMSGRYGATPKIHWGLTGEKFDFEVISDEQVATNE
jgi:hypothetical protein